MKKQVIVSLSAVAIGTLLSACGDDVTKVTNEVSGMEVVASADSLGKCESSNIGKTVFASDENAAYICADSGWVPLSKKQEDVVCVAEQLSDSSGYKIVCGGDSVGVVKNGSNGENGSDGKNGESGESGTSCTVENLSDVSGYKVLCGGDSVGVIVNGATGENGADGSSCSLTDNGDGTVTQVCGADTVTLYKAFCGGSAYDPTKKFCLADSAYDLCGSKSYDVTSSFCAKDSIYDLCGEKAYDPSTEFCDSRNATVYGYAKIGEQTWMAENLNIEYNEGTAKSYCYNNNADSCAKYGRLYTWSAAMDSATVFSEDGKDCGNGTTCSATGNVRGVCPAGWHLPSNGEWNTLSNYVAANTTGGVDSVGYALKSASGWKDGENGSDAFGFGALPAGSYSNTDSFHDILTLANFWSSTETNYITAPHWLISNALKMLNNKKSVAFSVRCVKD